MNVVEGTSEISQNEIVELQKKLDKVGKYMDICIYTTMAILILSGILGKDFIITFIVAKTTSKIVKVAMKYRKNK